MKESGIFSEFYELIKKIKIYHIAAVFIISALLLSLSFCSYRTSLAKIERCTAKVYGTVSHTEVKTEHKWRYQDGKKVRYSETTTTAYILVETDNVFRQSAITRRNSSLSKGTKVTIHYDPDDSSIYYLDGEAEAFNFLPIMGILFLALGSAMTILYRVNKREQENFYY